MYYFKMYSSSRNKNSYMFNTSTVCTLLYFFFKSRIQGHAWLIIADAVPTYYRHTPVLNVQLGVTQARSCNQKHFLFPIKTQIEQPIISRLPSQIGLCHLLLLKYVSSNLFLDQITRFSPVTPPPGTPADCVRATRLVPT